MDSRTCIERFNAADGLGIPKGYKIPALCQNCYRGISFRSLADPVKKHPKEEDVFKCEFHDCWVDTNGICPDYTINALDRG